ncbi:MAG: glucose-6-phosphate dehydrogenase assembly protein OpcA [Brooklawnia sp.]|uniref:glucose-6-phosphate dehydrogenase assembly protein OpcA n=1 Tax=Brooklawnia sp. TaxID=2699740 RepID=UPI003C77A0D8
MTIRLENTDARQINETLFRLRKEGQASSGQVLTLVVNTPAEGALDATAEARQAASLHPSRMLIAIRGLANEAGLNAEVASFSSATEIITLEFSGEVDEHAESVLLPLLLPELPVVIWWPSKAPKSLPNRDLRGLTNRLIVDSSTADDPVAAVRRMAKEHSPGTTDLAWTRLTRWRAMLVAALDQVTSPVTAAAVIGPPDSSPSELLAAWLELRLQIQVSRPEPVSDYPGLHAVLLDTERGQVALRRVSPTDAVLTLPGQPDRPVALARRSMQELLTEELARLNGDAAFDELMGHIARRDHA